MEDLFMKAETKRYFLIAGIIFLLYLCIHYWERIQGLLPLAVSAAMPLLIGCIIAYLVNVLMSFYEKRYFPYSTKKVIVKTRRTVCMVAALLTFTVLIAVIFMLILPEFIDCIMLLINMIPGAIEATLDYIGELHILPEDIFAMLEGIDWKSRVLELVDSIWSGVGNVVDIAIKTVSSVFSGLVTALVALIFSLYLLAGKERVAGQCKRLLARYLPARINTGVLHVADILNDCFTRYVVGQCTEAVILGVLCTVGMLIFRFPYATMIGALVAFTALIPIAGAYIGAIVGAFMILTQSPVQAFFFLIFILVLQQLEGNIIYPRVVGSSIGLPGIWVLAAVTVGGGVMGVFGMLLGVPLAAAAYRLLREDVNRDAQKAAGAAMTETEAVPAVAVNSMSKPVVHTQKTEIAPKQKKTKKQKGKT